MHPLTKQDKTVITVGKVDLNGIQIPPQWMEHLRFPNGKVNFVAVWMLAILWDMHKPIIIQDAAGRPMKKLKKFKGDKLQLSYKQIAEAYPGFTDRQIRAAAKMLEDMELVKRDFRTIKLKDGRLANNVLYWDIYPARIVAIGTSPITLERDSPITLERDTNTINNNIDIDLSSFKEIKEENIVKNCGCTDSRQCKVCALTEEILALWIELYPKNSQFKKVHPRASTIRASVKRRMKQKEFLAKDSDGISGWEHGLRAFRDSVHCSRAGWFQLKGFFLRNDDNWQKAMNGYFASFDEQIVRREQQDQAAQLWEGTVFPAITANGKYRQPNFEDSRLSVIDSGLWHRLCDTEPDRGFVLFKQALQRQNSIANWR